MENLESIFNEEATLAAIEIIEELTQKLLQEIDKESKGE